MHASKVCYLCLEVLRSFSIVPSEKKIIQCMALRKFLSDIDCSRIYCAYIFASALDKNHSFHLK